MSSLAAAATPEAASHGHSHGNSHSHSHFGEKLDYSSVDEKQLDSTTNAGDSAADDIDDEEDSPHFEVRAAVSNKDDPTLPSLTFRVILLGLIFTAALSFVNQFFAFRAQPVGLSVLVVQILSFPLGKLLSWLLPRTQFST
ncbi:OPT-domain-containing protein, partial [Ramicandelaber brevisporus]